MRETEIASKLRETEFKASSNWLVLFKKRHIIQQYVLQGEAGSADKIYVEVGKTELPSILSGTPHKDIYNGDETVQCNQRLGKIGGRQH